MKKYEVKVRYSGDATYFVMAESPDEAREKGHHLFCNWNEDENPASNEERVESTSAVEM